MAVNLPASWHGDPQVAVDFDCQCVECVASLRDAERARALSQEARRVRQESLRMWRHAQRMFVNGRWVAPLVLAKHGTWAAWRSWGCECETCLTAKRASRGERVDG